jgi:hypothetical protein
VSLANWAGIDAVNQDVATMAGFLMMSVPVLALMVMRGTMSVANNLGSMLAPVQAGSDAAALERTTGNYAYGDVSYGNLNAEKPADVAMEHGAQPPVRCRACGFPRGGRAHVQRIWLRPFGHRYQYRNVAANVQADHDPWLCD